MIKLIVGLGNPGLEYQKTRHNVGFMTLDHYAKAKNVEFKEEKKFKGAIAIINEGSSKTILLKPLTYMNLSGESVLPVMKFYKINLEDLLVVVDDLDSSVGRIRIRENGSAGGHNGLKSIFYHLGTMDVRRLKIGIGRDKRMDAATYVLGKFTNEDEPLIAEAIMKATSALADFSLDLPFNKIASKYSTK